MPAERRTLRNWGARLGAEDEMLTLEEARTYAMMAATDRLLESRDLLQDLQMRLMRLEQFLAGAFPGYDVFVAERLKALKEGS